MMKDFLIGALVSLFLVTAAEAKIGGGDITFTMRDAGKVVYSHELHVEKMKITCTECHYRIYSRTANSEADKTTMTGMQSGRSCGACHNGSRAFTVSKNCLRCHQNRSSAEN